VKEPVPDRDRAAAGIDYMRRLAEPFIIGEFRAGGGDTGSNPR
jgi:hypothetical protein